MPKARYWITHPRADWSQSPEWLKRWDLIVEVRPGEEAHEYDVGRLHVVSATVETIAFELSEFKRLGYEIVSELERSLEVIGA